MPRALVIGGTGPTGPFVVGGLLERGYDVTILHTGHHEIPEILDPASSGVTEMAWQEPFPQGQEGAVTAEVRYTVGVVDVVPTDVEFDLRGVPAGR